MGQLYFDSQIKNCCIQNLMWQCPHCPSDLDGVSRCFHFRNAVQQQKDVAIPCIVLVAITCAILYLYHL